MTIDANVALLSLAITTGATFLGTLSTMFYQAWTSGRQRRWDVEDRDKKEKKIQETLEAANAELLLRLEANTALTKESGAMAEKAYHEANTVNLKIADLHKESIATNERATEGEKLAGKTLTGITKTGDDTNTRVRNIEASKTP